MGGEAIDEVAVADRSERLGRVGTTVGFVLLAVPTVVLFGLGVSGAIFEGTAVVVGGSLVVVTVGVATGIRYEWWFLTRHASWNPIVSGEAVRIAFAILGGTILTIAIVVETGLSPVVSAAIVGIVAAVLWPSYAVPAYCGAFVGMTSPELFVTYWHAAFAGVVATVVFVVAQPVFHGLGGKLGTTAFVGATVTVFATAGTFQSDPLPPFEVLISAVAVAVVGAVVTFALHTRFGTTSVFASGVVGVAGGVLLPVLAGHGELLAATVFSASFAGMADPKRIPDERWMALTGVFVGVVVVYTMPYLGGSGGKLGTIAFGSCLAVHGLLLTRNVIRFRRRAFDVPRRDTT